MNLPPRSVFAGLPSFRLSWSQYIPGHLSRVAYRFSTPLPFLGLGASVPFRTLYNFVICLGEGVFVFHFELGPVLASGTGSRNQ